MFIDNLIIMRVTLTVNADELKIAQLLAKFSEQYGTTYTLKRNNGGFVLQMNVNQNNFGEFVRRLNHLKDCTFKVEEVHGGGLLDKLNVSPTKTNVDALVDKTTVAKTDIDPVDGGVIKLMGELWFCRPEYEEVIKEGAKVRVVRVEGVSLIVEEVK
jgi:hypothetical protein